MQDPSRNSNTEQVKEKSPRAVRNGNASFGLGPDNKWCKQVPRVWLDRTLSRSSKTLRNWEGMYDLERFRSFYFSWPSVNLCEPS